MYAINQNEKNITPKKGEIYKEMVMRGPSYMITVL